MAGFWCVDAKAAMGRFEVAWLPAFGLWTEAVHGVVVAGFGITGAVCAVALAVQVYRYALTGLTWVLGKARMMVWSSERFFLTSIFRRFFAMVVFLLSRLVGQRRKRS